MNRFLILLTIIVISRGYLILNEQFLVRICFVRFIRTVILYSGDDIKNNLEIKRNELLANEAEYIEKKKFLNKQLLTILKRRIGISSNLTSLNQNIINSTQMAFTQEILKAKTIINDIILTELQTLYQLEQSLIPRIQIRILINIDQSLKNSSLLLYSINNLEEGSEELSDELTNNKNYLNRGIYPTSLYTSDDLDEDLICDEQFIDEFKFKLDSEINNLGNI